MRLTRLRLSNFKIFEDEEFSLTPITLLTGCNSSGKSAILTALAATLQTAPPRFFPFEIVLNGENCLLGSYKDVTRGHTTKRVFSIGFDVTDGKREVSIDASFRYSPRGDHLLPSQMRYATGGDLLALQWDSAKRAYRCSISGESIRILGEDELFMSAVRSLSELMAQNEPKKRKGKPDSIEAMLADYLNASPHQELWIRHISSARALPKRIAKMPVASLLMSNLQRFMHQLGDHVSYVGPIRATPLRYYGPDQPHSNVDPSGSYCAQMLYSWSQHSTERFELVAALLNELELVSKVTPSQSGDEILRVLVRPYAQKDTSNFADVGFGVSQILPIVVADVALQNGGILLVNQPEVHLHPASQARLANYMGSRIDQRQYVVETHSEYVINRFRLLVMQGKIDPEDISIVFLEPCADTGGVTRHDIRMTRDGKLTGAPRGFFETYYVDSFELAMGEPEEEE